MPGGKIVFYTVILPIAKTTDGIAAIMGHEIAHALTDRGAQRMSTNTLKTGLDFFAARSTEKQPEEKRKKIIATYGYGSQLSVIIPFSRKHEIEAAEVWRRMQAYTDGKVPPEILSTHPSSQRRIKTLEAHICYGDSLAKVIQK